MNPTPDFEHVFPLSGGSSEPLRLRAPRLALLVKATPGGVLGHRAFMRSWAARRAGRAAESGSLLAGEIDPTTTVADPNRLPAGSCT